MYTKPFHEDELSIFRWAATNPIIEPFNKSAKISCHILEHYEYLEELKSVDGRHRRYGLTWKGTATIRELRRAGKLEG